jgi:2,3-dimethylmalate lyase
VSGETPGQVLRRLIRDEGPLLAPGAVNALGARLVADAGFEAVYASGAGIANWSLGAPDIGLTTLTEMADSMARICDAVDLPVVADADTGYGNEWNVARTVRLYERAGVAAIQLEDQVEPKRCGHFEGKEVIPLADMVAKIRAAADVRRNPALMLIARTDARAVEGIEAAIDRAHAFRRAGADMIFIEAPQSEAELARIGAEVPGPLVANMVEDGKTPLLPLATLGKMGFALVLYANFAPRAAMHAMQLALAHLRSMGSSHGFEDRIVSMDERNRLTGLAAWQAFARKARSQGGQDR